MPREVICLTQPHQEHVPPVSVIAVDRRKNIPGVADDIAGALEPYRNAVGLECGENHREIACVLVQRLAAGLTFLLQGLKLRATHRRQKLNDDRGRECTA